MKDSTRMFEARDPELEPVLSTGSVVDWDHAVQFYRSDDFLCDAVAEFVKEGLRRGERVVVLSTTPHRDAIIDRLTGAGLSWDDARLSRQLRWRDARAVLESIMIGGDPDPERFDMYVSSLIRETVEASGGAGVRAFGELVDLLWRQGDADAALDLEDMWNDLGRRHAFSLLCGYSKGNIYRESRADRRRQICHRHARVMPAEDGEPVAAGD